MYQSINDLPETIRKTYPREAQEIYLAEYQTSWENYTEAQGGDMGRAAVAHRNATMAVKSEYKKDSETGKWYPIDEEIEHTEEQEDEGLIEQVKDALT